MILSRQRLSGTAPGSPASHCRTVTFISPQKLTIERTPKKRSLIEPRANKPILLQSGQKLAVHVQAAQELVCQACNLNVYVQCVPSVVNASGSIA